MIENRIEIRIILVTSEHRSHRQTVRLFTFLQARFLFEYLDHPGILDQIRLDQRNLHQFIDGGLVLVDMVIQQFDVP